VITDFGKILRIIRINRGESAKEMAEKLNISTSYLSAIENGKRNIPKETVNLILTLYNLSDKESENLRRAVMVSSGSMKIDLTDLTEKKKQAIIALTKKDLDEEIVDKLCQILNKGKTE
jgi:transcriptional regulator with XRE-family HTH domain